MFLSSNRSSAKVEERNAITGKEFEKGIAKFLKKQSGSTRDTTLELQLGQIKDSVSSLS